MIILAAIVIMVLLWLASDAKANGNDNFAAGCTWAVIGIFFLFIFAL